MLCYRCRREFGQNEHIFEGLHEACFCDWFQLKEVNHFENVIARAVEVESGPFNKINSSFFHGKFRKYSAELNGVQYILKVQQPEFPELPVTEFICNSIASILSLQTSPFYLIRFQNELTTFVCKNFMQEYSASNLIHIYRFIESPDQFCCEGLLRVIEEKVGKVSDVHHFIDLTLFDALIGNHDRHGRNLALIQSREGFKLAPFYDNPSYIAIEDKRLLGAMHEPRGAIATKNTIEPTMKDYAIEWDRLGFRDRVNHFLKQIPIDKIEELIHESFISKKRQLALIRLIKRRYQELCHAF